MKISNSGEIFYSGETTVSGISYGFFDCIAPNIIDFYNSILSSDNIAPENNGWAFSHVKIIGDEINAMEFDNSNKIYIARISTVTSQQKKYLSVYKLGKNGEQYYYLNIIIDDYTKDFGASKIKIDASGNLYVVGYE
jgi:hypothetical protein